MLAPHETIRPEIGKIFRDVFEYDGPVSPGTSPDEIERWDSLQHIALVRVIEETFEIALSMDEMMELDCAGSIERLLQRRGV